ncbi:MAG: hypothetical protein U9Q06_04355 [Nanoarchaeota archaeon]|nr:hypothetical protein [Nanoarchaeota archaeon]
MEIKEYLKSKGIEFKTFKHAPVYTCEEAKKERIYGDIMGYIPKIFF